MNRLSDPDDDFDNLGDEDAWQEEEMEHTPARCLFCAELLESPDAVFQHCAEKHHFNIRDICKRWDLDCFGYIKMINFIRSQKVRPENFTQFDKEHDKPPWGADTFMQPFDSEDEMLQFDIDEILEEISSSAQHSCDRNFSHTLPATKGSGYMAPSTEVGKPGANCDTVTLSSTEYQSLLHRLQTAESQVKNSEEQLQLVLQDLENMRVVAKDLITSVPDDTGVSQSAGCLDDLENDPYFSGYAHFSIHEEMLKVPFSEVGQCTKRSKHEAIDVDVVNPVKMVIFDKGEYNRNHVQMWWLVSFKDREDRVRTESYRDMMYLNKSAFKDRLVLDVGCGTGILSLFAAKAGAKHVYAVDQSEVIYQAMDIARENNLTDKITFIKGRLEDIQLPVNKVDIIVSEWMGYFLLFESMLDSVLFARAKYLKLDGAVYPDRCTVSLTATSDLDLYNKHVTYWENVYGFKMTCMKSSVIRESSVYVVKPETIATDHCVIKEIDVCTCGLDDLQFASQFQLTALSDKPIVALVGYFDIYFEKHFNEKVHFSTGPDSSPTHWKQSVFLLDRPMQTEKGKILTGSLTCKKNRKDPRSLNITVKLNDRIFTYLME